MSQGSTIKLRTTCEGTLFAGFFGINENGDQPECMEEITIEVEEESIEREGDQLRPCYAVECPKCKRTIEWPQEWEAVKEMEKDGEGTQEADMGEQVVREAMENLPRTIQLIQ